MIDCSTKFDNVIANLALNQALGYDHIRLKVLDVPVIDSITCARVYLSEDTLQQRGSSAGVGDSHVG